MPRLGDDDDDNDEMQPLHRRRQAVAYPGGGIDSQPSKRILYGVVLLICLIWILPNFFFRDYREEALESLRASGKTEAQIERFFPKSLSEKRKEQTESYQTLKEELNELRLRVRDLEQHVQIPNRTMTARKEEESGS